MTLTNISTKSQAARQPAFESLESRELMSASSASVMQNLGQPALFASSTAIEMSVTHPRASHAAVKTAKSVATAKSPSKVRQAVVARAAMSVVTISNPTNATVGCQFEWQGQTSWTTCVLAPKQSQILYHAGQNDLAFVRYDYSYAPGVQLQTYTLTSKPFVTGGREGWTPLNLNDGTIYSFSINSTNSGVDLHGNYGVDTTHNFSLRSRVSIDFPSFQGKFEVLGPSTPMQSASTDTYNCIAWSLGITNHWVWPGSTLGDFDRLYASYGYQRLSVADFRAQAGVQKIALYAVNGKCTHAARQNADGTWSSKLGADPLIRHNLVDAFGNTNNTYGHPIAVYVKYA